MPRQPGDIADATLRVVMAQGIGPATLRRLREHFGDHDDDRIAGASVHELKQVPGIGDKMAETIRRGLDQAEPQRERTLMAERGAMMIVLGDDDYPPLLKAINDPPGALWLRGELTVADYISIGIVGSRKCSSYGREQAARFASMLAQCGYTIVSGGALGIDGEAHRGAMRVRGRTIAVMGCGLSDLYPPQHSELFEQVVQNGAVISEFPMAVEPRPDHFPRRNRIISGLSAGILVIEAATRSGALITARLASEDHGREVMAVPGRVDSPASAGCLAAIREGWAALVTSAADVLAQLESAGHLVRGAMEAAGKLRPDVFGHGNGTVAPLSATQQAIVDVLRDAAGGGSGAVVELDQLASTCGMPMGQIMAELTLLELRGHVRRSFRGVELRR